MPKKAASDLFRPLEDRKESFLTGAHNGAEPAQLPSPADRCMSHGFDPIEELIQMYRSGKNTVMLKDGTSLEMDLTNDQKLSILKEIALYVHGKPKAPPPRKIFKVSVKSRFESAASPVKTTVDLGTPSSATVELESVDTVVINSPDGPPIPTKSRAPRN